MGLPTNTVKSRRVRSRVSYQDPIGRQLPTHGTYSTGSDGNDLGSPKWFCVRPEILLLVLIAQD